MAATAWHVPDPLDLRAMEAAADTVIGQHDFRAFCRRAPGSPAGQPIVRTVTGSRWGVLTGPEEAEAGTGRLLRFGPQEHEIRACALHACELLSARLTVAPRVLDNWLWNRGQSADHKALPRHRCRCVFY